MAGKQPPAQPRDAATVMLLRPAAEHPAAEHSAGSAGGLEVYMLRRKSSMAVRETFEESGVLLAGPSAGSVAADTTGEDWEADRRALLDRSLSLAEMLARRGLVLRSDLLRPWSRWITPVIEERRFDARFFAAALPSQQRTRDVGGEAAAVAWVRPGDAIAMGRRKEYPL